MLRQKMWTEESSKQKTDDAEIKTQLQRFMFCLLATQQQQQQILLLEL